jgi:hypothetical protein
MHFNDSFQRDRSADGRAALHFTPAEWHALLADRGFLRSDDNSFEAPRRLMGVPVEIVPDHGFG